jgi:hypothetical protein
MKKVKSLLQSSACLFALLTCLPLANSAASSVKLTLKPSVGMMSGYTKYVMDIRGQFESGEIGSIKSELEFPLDVTVVGFQFGIGPAPHIHNDWGIDVSYATSQGDPSGLMLDSDWMYDPSPGGINGQFSYTESHTSMDATFWSIQARKSIHWQESFAIGVTAEYRHQKIYQEVLDLAGWQKDGSGQLYEVTYDGLAGTYEVKYNLIAGGFYSTIQIGGRGSFSTRLLGARVSSSDTDNHVLRNKRSNSHGTGAAIIGGATARVNLRSRTARIVPFVQAEGEFLSLSVRTSELQYWYGDDPVTEEDDTGSSLDAIPHHLTSRQYQLRLALGISF